MLYKLDFVIHSVRSILNLKKEFLVFVITFDRHIFFSKDMTVSVSYLLRFDIRLAISIFPVAKIRKIRQKTLEKENISLLKEILVILNK